MTRRRRGRRAGCKLCGQPRCRRAPGTLPALKQPGILKKQALVSTKRHRVHKQALKVPSGNIRGCPHKSGYCKFTVKYNEKCIWSSSLYNGHDSKVKWLNGALNQKLWMIGFSRDASDFTELFYRTCIFGVGILWCSSDALQSDN